MIIYFLYNKWLGNQTLKKTFLEAFPLATNSTGSVADAGFSEGRVQIWKMQINLENSIKDDILHVEELYLENSIADDTLRIQPVEIVPFVSDEFGSLVNDDEVFSVKTCYVVLDTRYS